MIKRIFSFGVITWLAILALAVGLSWQLFMRDKIESSKIDTLEKSLTQHQQAFDQITHILQTHDEQFQQIAEHSNKVVESVKELDNIVRGDSHTWRLMQIQNFLEMAMVQATLLNDTNTAINLLAAADNSLKQIDNPNLIPVRKALQEDINTLANHPVSNVSSIILQINGISERIPSLPHKIRLQKETPSINPEPATSTEQWEQRAYQAWVEFKSLIRIKRHDQPITPYFSQDDVWLINENLQLMLQQASFAAAHHYNDLYKEQLKHAQDWVAQYFDLSDPAVQTSLKTLTELSQLSVASDTNLHLKTVDAWSKFVINSKAGGQ